jgi:hypothetical protein
MRIYISADGVILDLSFVERVPLRRRRDLPVCLSDSVVEIGY